MFDVLLSEVNGGRLTTGLEAVDSVGVLAPVRMLDDLLSEVNGGLLITDRDELGSVGVRAPFLTEGVLLSDVRGGLLTPAREGGGRIEDIPVLLLTLRGRAGRAMLDEGG